MRDIDGVIAQLDEIVDDAIGAGDAIGYFAVLYRKVTARVKEGLGEGWFDDAERIEELDVRFAERYLDAVAAHRDGAAVTSSWQLTFDAGTRWRPLILQQLLVGINAHINLDLGIAAAETAPGDQLDELRDDYDRINGVLAAMVASVQRDLLEVSPWMTLLDRFGARSQTELVRFSIVAARAGAWRFATRLNATPRREWPAAIDERDRAVARVGHRVLHPGPWPSLGLLLARLREQRDVAANLRLLRDAAEPSAQEVARATGTPSLHPDA